ncbi:MAG: GNAT family N-acetyltransferase [Thiolinea sp.]
MAEQEPEQGLVIRKAVKEDVEVIVRLANAGGPEGRPRRELPDVLPDAYYQAFTRIIADANQQLMVAESQGTVVGTFHLTFIYYLAAAGRPDLQIEAIHVAANQRRRGLGTKMLQWAIALAQEHDCRRVQLTTDKRRREAHGLYLRLGFVFSHEGAKLYL